MKSGIGIDPDEPSNWPAGPYEFRQGRFPEALNPADRFDAITMLAVIEHVPDEIRKKWFETVRAVLKPGGRIIITVPAPLVDRLLDIGIRLHLLHGMDAESHHGFDPHRRGGAVDATHAASARFPLRDGFEPPLCLRAHLLNRCNCLRAHGTA